MWRHCEDASGRSYFYNEELKESRWELPEGAQDWLECDDPKSDGKFFFNPARDVSTWEHPRTQQEELGGWIECVDSASGRTYYYNQRERASVWHRPGGGDEYDVAKKVMQSSLAHMDKEALDGSLSQGKGQSQGKGVSEAQLGRGDGDDDQEEEEESKQRRESHESHESGASEEFALEDPDFGVSPPAHVLPEGSVEFHDYVYKEGGGTSTFGRKTWRRRFIVIKHGEIGWFKSFKDYASGAMPIKGRWTALGGYRLEEMLNDILGVRLLPRTEDDGDRVWNLKCDDEDKKAKLMCAMEPHIVSSGFVKHLDRQLSARKFIH